MRDNRISAIYSAGLIQGVALVAFPAAGTIFTNPQEFNFSNTEYGVLFIPQTLFSIVCSALSPSISKLFGSKFTYLTGLSANLVSMLLLAFSPFVMHHSMTALMLLLLATSCLGIGFGLTVPTLNSMAALLRPDKADTIILTLNALLGTGTALAPIFIAIFIGIGFWFGLPILLVILTALLIIFSLPLQLPGGKLKVSVSISKQSVFSRRFLIFAAFALFYGIMETLNGNWVTIYMKKYQEASPYMQSFALAIFWGMVTVGRIFFAWFSRHYSEKFVYQILPLVSMVAFICIALIPPHRNDLSLLAFGLSGFGCSALLPLTISFGSAQLSSISTSVAGGIIAFYLLGYGIAAFGVGPLQVKAHLDLSEIYSFGAAIALVLVGLSYVINHDDNVLKKGEL